MPVTAADKARSTSPTFDPSTWNILPASSAADEQNSLLARLVAQMTANSTSFQNPTYDNISSFPPNNAAGPSTAQAQHAPPSSRNGSSMQASQPTQGPQGQGQPHPWNLHRSNYSDAGGPMSFGAPAASPPFNLDMDAQLLNELFASYTGSNSVDQQAARSIGGAVYPTPSTTAASRPARDPDPSNIHQPGSAPIPMPYQSMNGSGRQSSGTGAPVRSYFGSS
jgi:hypothetical protein